MLNQPFSQGRFPINEDLLRKLLTRYQVSPLLLDSLQGVSTQDRLSENGQGNAFFFATPSIPNRFGS
jgi:hypothetical protein